jgi:phosphoglycolate phosphatase-like HAD superfamily hydrolase
MDIRAVLFDVNGTLVDIVTDEGMEQIFRSASHLLTYQGIDLRRHQLRDLYFHHVKAQQDASAERESGIRRGRGLAHDRRRPRDRLHAPRSRRTSVLSFRCCWPS